MEWLAVDERYLDYMREKDNRIPRSNYGVDKYKPFFGVLFETDDFYYITQVSHAQPRHQRMKNNIDFKKLYDSEDGHLLAVVNLNYMFPLPKNEKVKLEYKDIELHRTFSSEQEKSKYIDLLKKEMRILDSLNLEKAARFIYSNKCTQKNKIVADRCLDFKQMEVHAKEYMISKE